MAAATDVSLFGLMRACRRILQPLIREMARSGVLSEGHRPLPPPPEHLAAVADQLTNRRPRKTLGWETPAERLHRILAA
ncbi:hypothetical protein OV450_8160 [Actinobacteria bacterium OV450]|nr:hypothetical protein OV450_8160 [Actinobacteria bacterium OV450]